jgi:hypothetical protein
VNDFTVDVRDLHRLTRNLRAYLKIYPKSENEVLNRKGNQLRFELFKAYRLARWRAGEKKDPNRLLKTLLSAGRGVLVRVLRRVEPFASQVDQTDKNGKPLNFWQLLVGQEMARRSAGVGVLAAGFLRKTWRYKKEGRYLTENRTSHGTAVTFEKKDHEFIITGFTPGLERIARKYGIMGTALNNVSKDTENYLARKLGPEFVANLHKA